VWLAALSGSSTEGARSNEGLWSRAETSLSNSSHTGDLARELTTRVVTGTDNSRQGYSPRDETW
jgi:hypothetical protein